MRLKLTEICEILSGRLISANEAAQAVEVQGVECDTRRLSPQGLFVALPGERADGHDFLPAAAQAGAAAALVTRPVDGCDLPQIVVEDAAAALWRLAAVWRQRHSCRRVAITGSNGKTTVKEMLYSIMAAAVGEAHCLCNSGNFNNHLGVPLTLLRLRPEHQLAVIEAGMDSAGELARLSALIQPDVALINNAQRAHIGHFSSLTELARAKGELLAGLAADGTAVLNADDAHFSLWCELAEARRVVSFAAEAPATVHATLTDDGILLNNEEITLAVPGRHNKMNALAAAAAAVALDLPPAAIVQGLTDYCGVGGRLTVHQLAKETLLIDDTYNANPDSAAAALAVLAELAAQRGAMPLLIMGDMLMLGDSSDAEHGALVADCAARGVQLFGVGECMQAALADGGGRYFSAGARDGQLVAEVLRLQQQHGRLCVLVKGSRAMQMEKVIAAIMRAFTDGDGDSGAGGGSVGAANGQSDGKRMSRARC